MQTDSRLTKGQVIVRQLEPLTDPNFIYISHPTVTWDVWTDEVLGLREPCMTVSLFH